MLYELDKIDSMRYDNKETVTVYIFDMDMWKGKYEEHEYYTKKKIELCVNFILTGNAAKNLEISPDVVKHYDIAIISQETKVPEAYLQLLNNIAAEIKQGYGDLITLQVSHEIDKAEKKEKKGFLGLFKKK